MAKTNRELPPDKLLERVLAVAELLAAPPDNTSVNGQSASSSVAPIVNQFTSGRKIRLKNRDDRS